MDEDSSTKQKTLQVCSFRKRNVFKLHLNESGEGFCRRGRGRSFHVDISIRYYCSGTSDLELQKSVCCVMVTVSKDHE